MEWKGQFCGESRASHRCLATTQEWRQAWSQIGQPAPPAPDFSRQVAVLVFLGERPTGGFGVQWLDPAASAAVLVVRYKLAVPRGMVPQVLTQPYALKLFPKTAPEVRVEAL